jgi:AAA ATPase-like protein
MIFIGPQSAGKSTISKLVFYFYHVRDETVAHLLESLEQGRGSIDWKGYYPRLRRRFVEFWGPTPQAQDVEVEFDYGNGVQLKITVAKSRRQNFYNLDLTPKTQEQLDALYARLRASFHLVPRTPNLFASPEAIVTQRARAELVTELKSRCADIFGFDRELLFIPAGRSLLSTLSDQLQYVQPHLLDFPMRQFVDRVNLTKSFFGKSLDALIEEQRIYWRSNMGLAAVERTKEIIQRVLKADYRHDQEGGKLYVRENVFTKINYASSGQQEAIWILLSLFLVTLERARAIIFVEEPEAHLFPTAQKDIVELIAFTHNSLGCDYLITTHSPYVLSAINNYVYAHNLGNSIGEAVTKVVPRDLWISARNLAGYFVSEGRVQDLVARDLDMLKTELIDSASDQINAEFEALLELEAVKHNA